MHFHSIKDDADLPEIHEDRQTKNEDGDLIEDKTEDKSDDQEKEE